MSTPKSKMQQAITRLQRQMLRKIEFQNPKVEKNT
jgi:hypothetical protein